MTTREVGRSLIDLGEQLMEGGEPVNPIQLGMVLIHVGRSVALIEDRLSDLESAVRQANR